MDRPAYYTARDGLIWSAGNHTVRTVDEAFEAAPHLIGSAVCASTPQRAQDRIDQLADLITAVRQARLQKMAANDTTDNQSEEKAA